MISVLACKDTLSFSSFSNVAFRWTCQPTRHNGPGETGAPQQRRPPWQVQQLGPRVHGQPIHHFHRRWWWWLGRWVGGWVVVQAGCKFLFFFCVLEQTCHLLGYFRHLTPKHGCLFLCTCRSSDPCRWSTIFSTKKKTVQYIHENVSKKTMDWLLHL